MNALDNVLKVSAVVCLTTVTIFTGVVGVKVYRTIDNFNAVGESLNEASKIGVDFLNSLRNSISDEIFFQILVLFLIILILLRILLRKKEKNIRLSRLVLLNF